MPTSLRLFRVRAKRVQNHCRQHLNALLLGEYLTDLEDHTRKTDDLENLNIKYAFTNSQQPCPNISYINSTLLTVSCGCVPSVGGPVSFCVLWKEGPAHPQSSGVEPS